ncbi:MAG: GH92 family glycosyl hydrolase, partial [Bacteroidota bacterium]
MKIFFSLLVLLSISYAQDDLTQFVNPFIGTAQHGHTYPGATVPFGMVQLSPDNGMEGWDWCSGYNYADSVIKGFSHTHLSGTGIGDLCDILFMPAILDDPNGAYASRFSHAEEKAEPGYYRVHLLTPNIAAELTATTRAGFHRYTFPESEHSRIIIDLGHRLNWDSPVKSRITVLNKTLITGYRFSEGWAKDQKIFFAAKFSKPIRQFRLGNDSIVFSNINAIEGEAVKGVLDFETSNNEKIMVKVGISAVSIDGALKNLDAEIPDWDFDGVRKSAQQLWNGELKKIRVTGSDRGEKEIFYTALYHTMLAPVVYNDADGKYRGGDGEIHNGAGFTNYTIFSLWDTFRAAHPLYTIIQPERVNDFINTMLAFKKESGFLPVWTLHANETNCMIGYHSVPVIVDAYMKGFRNYDTEEAFASMVKSAQRNANGLQWYREYGYV